MSDVEERINDLEARMEAFGNFQSWVNQELDSIRDEISGLDTETSELEDKIGRVQSVVDTDPEKVEYDRLTRDDKVHRIRSKLVEYALNTNGRAAMDYKDVMKAFNGNPSPGHTFNLMELAGELDGFDYQERDGKKNRIVVKTDSVKDVAAFHDANNGIAEEAI